MVIGRRLVLVAMLLGFLIESRPVQVSQAVGSNRFETDGSRGGSVACSAANFPARRLI